MLQQKSFHNKMLSISFLIIYKIGFSLFSVQINNPKLCVHPTPGDLLRSSLNLHFLRMLPHQFQFLWPNGLKKKNTNFPHLFICKKKYMSPHLSNILSQMIFINIQRQFSVFKVIQFLSTKVMEVRRKKTKSL